MVKWDAWGGEGERNYLVVKRVKRVRDTSRELCTERERERERERGRIHKNSANLVECVLYINNYDCLITYNLCA